MPATAEAVADHTSFIPAESVTGPAGAVYQTQIAFEQAKRAHDYQYEWVVEEHFRAASRGRPPLTQPSEHPEVRKLRKEMEAKRVEMERAQAEIGGVVMCIETEANLPKAIKRMASLSRRAVKLGLDPITLKVTDETIVLNYAYDYDGERSHHADFLHTYCILSGGTPKVEGFHFLATIEHTPAGNIVKKVPVLAAQMKGLVASGPEQQAREALEAIDVSAYRSGEPICQHCGLKKAGKTARKATYLVYNTTPAKKADGTIIPTGTILQVGRTCLRDYTGADNPEAIVKFLEMYFESMRPNNTERPKPVIRTRDFLAHVAAAGLGQNGEYLRGESANRALENYFDMLADARDTRTGRAIYITPSETHYEVADKIIDWALHTWDSQDDFATNVKVALANETVPQKSYGIAAAVFSAKQRWDGWQAKRQAEAEKPESNWIGQEKERIEFTATIIQKKYRGESEYGQDQWLIKLNDEQGNEIIWWANGYPRAHDTNEAVEENNTYLVRATIKAHKDDPRFGKSTVITRARFERTIKES